MNTKYNTIWTIIDLLIKYMYFILYKEGFMAEHLAYMFQKIIIIVYSMPEVIISDRKPTYTSKF